MSLSFRKANYSDLVPIVALLANDELGSKRENFSIPLPEKYINAFSKIINDPYHELMVAVLNEKVVACFQLSFLQYLTYQGGIRAQIEAVRVDENHRGEGIGKKCFEWAINRAKEKGAHLLQLTTDKQRPEALEFYKKLGFTASHEGLKMHFN